MENKANLSDLATPRDLYFTRLSSPVPLELATDFLSKLPYISEHLTEFELTRDGKGVHFRLAENQESFSALISRRISALAQKLCDDYRPFEPKVLVDRERPVVNQDDPHPILEASGDLVRFGQGRFGFGPRLQELLNFFDKRIEELAQRFTAEHCQFPSLIGADVLDRCKYLRSFPHSLSLVSHLKEDLASIQNFARTVRWDENKLNCDREDFSAIKCLLSPTVCFHCYAWLQDTCQPQPRVFTAVGKCFRYESGNLSGLERLWDFTMREIIFVGAAEYVLEQRKQAIDQTSKLLDEWELSYLIKSATDPFFIDEYSMGTFQMAFDLKFEIQAALPYAKKTVAVGSFNFHQDLFGRVFKISDHDGAAVNTGCVGFGLERLLLAFLAQHGLEREQWPASVSDEIKLW